jgi:enediyne biosynthesis protein E4
MQKRLPRAIITVFFLGLIAAPLVVKKMNASGSGNSRPVAQSEAWNRYGFQFQEVSKQSGVNFTHQAPTLDSRLEPIMPNVASMGAAVSVVDFDKDGWQDFYVTNSGENSQNHLYHNLKDGKFEEVAAKMGIADVNTGGTGVSMGSVWGDYDNDGYEDLLLYKWGRPELFHNEAGKGFRRVTEGTGLPQWMNANSAIWFDYDRDGKLDLFLAGYFDERFDLWNLKTSRIMPESFEYAKNGGRKYLLRNVGNGRFEDVTAQAGIDTRRWALSVVAADLRGTGYPDLFIANDYGVSELYFNEGGKRFREVGKETGVGFSPKSGMNAAVGDVMNNGQFAVYVSNIWEDGVLVQGNNLWMPQEGTAGDDLKFDNLANSMGVENGGWSFGAQFGDLNNDGTQDIYLVNGYISADKKQDYWYDYSKITVGNSSIISDASRWPPMKGRSLGGYQQKKVWINDGKGRFTEVAQGVGVTDVYDGRSVALADFWNRGVLDAVVANHKGPLLLYKNTAAPDNQWIALELEGSKSNRSAVGAQVKVYWNGQQQVQEIQGGSGFCAQNQRRLHFGLGKNANLEKVVIRWPSGKDQELSNLELNQLHSIKEPL